jgi:hypothetical protein
MPAFFAPSSSVNGHFDLHQHTHPSQLSQNAVVADENVHLYVPNAMIGAIIGSKGLFIRSIIKNSRASVKVLIIFVRFTTRTHTHLDYSDKF